MDTFSRLQDETSTYREAGNPSSGQVHRLSAWNGAPVDADLDQKLNPQAGVFNRHPIEK
jgi:hypothetical protein